MLRSIRRSRLRLSKPLGMSHIRPHSVHRSHPPAGFRFSRNVFCSQVAIGRADDRNALRGRLTMRMVFLGDDRMPGQVSKGGR